VISSLSNISDRGKKTTFITTNCMSVSTQNNETAVFTGQMQTGAN